MDEACKEYHRKRCTVIFDEDSNVVLKQGTGADDSTKVADHEDEESYHDGEIERRFGSLACEDLNAFLQIDKCNVEPEDIAREASNIFEGIAGVCDGEGPVHDH